MKKLIFFFLSIVSPLAAFGQIPPDEFFKGLDLLNTNNSEAKKEFLAALDKDSLFSGTYHFLGVIYLSENKIDSAIFCFKKSIVLNKDNINHTKEMTYVRLMDTYLYQHDFANSFSYAWEAYMLYPDNHIISQNLKDVCLWSFYIKYNHLDSSYLSPELKEKYIVNSIPEEYLIMRKVRINDQYLVFISQSLVEKKGISYDILSCSLSKSHEKVDLKFQLNWDLNKDTGGNVADAERVYENSANPLYERLGAKLTDEPTIDLKKAVEKLQE
jgi:tetratricopeptide (TPR) repeat protein